MAGRNEALSEWEREGREYARAKARLTPRQRARWAAIEESYEWFDGEAGIALAFLRRAKQDGSLNR